MTNARTAEQLEACKEVILTSSTNESNLEATDFRRQCSCESIRELRDTEAVTNYSREIDLIFGAIGLSTSVLWNQLMLCVEVLVELFGESALSSAASSQNICCALAMACLTLLPFGQTTRLRIGVTLVAVFMMMMLATGLAWALIQTALHQQYFPQWAFLTAVALNGVCTGASQNLAASLSGEFDSAPRALLLGEAMSPLAAVVISTSVAYLPLSSQFTASAVTLLVMQIFLVGAIWSLLKLRSLTPKVLPFPDTIGRCMSDGGSAQEYAYRRISELVGNSAVAIVCCAIWVFLLCSTPFIADGLCGGNDDCRSSLPKIMISVANVTAVSGRFLAFNMDGAKLWCLLTDCSVLCITGLVSVAACVKGLVATDTASPLVVGVSLSGVLTLWCNLSLMRNDHNAQFSCKHSILMPCPVTTQAIWLAIQTGSIGGTVLARYW
jgi:hypothetical protein